jgi:hypothetical protein
MDDKEATGTPVHSERGISILAALSTCVSVGCGYDSTGSRLSLALRVSVVLEGFSWLGNYRTPSRFAERIRDWLSGHF